MQESGLVGNHCISIYNVTKMNLRIFFVIGELIRIWKYEKKFYSAATEHFIKFKLIKNYKIKA